MSSPYEHEHDWWTAIGKGELIAEMCPYVQPVVHTHFMWTTWNYDNIGYVSPLDYLNGAPVQGEHFDWIFNPQEYPSIFESFFLADVIPASWPTNPSAVFSDTLDRNTLGLDVAPNGDIDLFFGYSLLGRGDYTNPYHERNDLTAERIKWDIVRETQSGDEEIESNYVVNFDCPLSNLEEEIPELHYFSLDLDELYNYVTDEYGGLIVCLSNCGDMQGWEGLGIDNIGENCWNTNSDYLFSGDVTNSILAAYPDGPYRVEVIAYAWDETVTDTVSIDVELHNFSPVIEEVVISCEGRTIWQAFWTADGLIPEWHNPVDLAVLPDQTLDVIVVFSEPMDTTSVTVTAGVSSPYNDITASDAETIFLI